MSATTYDLVESARIDQGSSYKVRLYLSSPTLDFSSYTGRAMIRKKYSDASPVATFTATPGSNLADPDPAKRYWLDLTLTAAQTAAIPVDAATSYKKKSAMYCYDVEIEFPGGQVIRLIEGAVEISPEVTK